MYVTEYEHLISSRSKDISKKEVFFLSLKKTLIKDGCVVIPRGLPKQIKMVVLSQQNDFFIKFSFKLHVLVENCWLSMFLDAYKEFFKRFSYVRTKRARQDLLLYLLGVPFFEKIKSMAVILDYHIFTFFTFYFSLFI